MRLPRVRVTVRRLMVVVAALALLLARSGHQLAAVYRQWVSPEPPPPHEYFWPLPPAGPIDRSRLDRGPLRGDFYERPWTGRAPVLFR
jgi:hypothetical protein